MNMNSIKQKPPKGLLFWIISLTLLVLLWNMLGNVSNGKTKKVTFSEFMDKVENNQIISAFISGNVVTGNMNPEESSSYAKYETNIPPDYPDLISILRKNKVAIEVEKLNKNEWLSILLSWAPFVIIIVFWVMVMRQQGGKEHRDRGQGGDLLGLRRGHAVRGEPAGHRVRQRARQPGGQP